MTRNLYQDVVVGTDTLSPTSVQVAEGYKQTCGRCSIEVEDIKNVGLNDEISIDMGYATDHAQMFTGFVDEITYQREPGTYMIEGRDALKLAIEYWLVTTNIDNPWSRSNIAAETLVYDLLNEAQVFAYATYSGDTSNYTFGTQSPAEFNLMSSWDAVRTILHIIAYNCYEKNGVVYFTRVFPEPAASRTSSEHIVQSGEGGNLVFIEYTYNTDNLRNKVVVFGKDGIYAEASSASPYLPSTPNTFYKTAIVSSELIETQSMADSSANYNLSLYNRLTEFSRIDVEGNPHVRAYDTVEVTEPLTEMNSELWFVYSADHTLNINSGYTMSLSLSK